MKKALSLLSVVFVLGFLSPPARTPLPQRAPSEAVPFTFAVVGDSRGEGWLEGLFLGNPGRARRIVVDRMAASDPAFVVNTGDFVRGGGDRKDWLEFEQLNKVFKDKRIPYFPVLGNHEYSGEQTKLLAGYFESFPVLKDQLWYTLTYGNCGLIMLDSNFSKQSKEQAERQNKWLEEALSKYQADSNIAFVFVFLHHPPYTNSRRHKPDRRVQEDFVPLLRSCPKVKFVFSGHVHAYERFKMNGINYVVTGGGGAPLETLLPAGRSRYRDRYDPTGTKPRGIHFCLVTVGRDSIELKTLNLDLAKLTWSAGDDYLEVYPPSAEPPYRPHLSSAPAAEPVLAGTLAARPGLRRLAYRVW